MGFWCGCWSVAGHKFRSDGDCLHVDMKKCSPLKFCERVLEAVACKIISLCSNSRSKKLFGQVKGNVCKRALGLVSMMLHCVIVRHTALVDPTSMRKIDSCGKIRLSAMHAPNLIISCMRKH